MLTVLRCRRFAFPFEHFERLAVGQARIRADEGRVNLIARKLRPLIDIHSTVMERRTSPGASEHSPHESSSGIIGITRLTRYTLVARRRAAKSSALPHST